VFLSFTNEHNHPPAVDLFDLSPHYNSDIDREKAKEITMAHRGTTTYTQSSDILEKYGLELDRRSFYNLKWPQLLDKEDDRTL
jgi:hypothetical protein